MQLVQLALIRPVVARSISKLALPKLPSVRSDVWRTHTSYPGNLHVTESPKGLEPRGYKRLEVCIAQYHSLDEHRRG